MKHLHRVVSGTVLLAALSGCATTGDPGLGPRAAGGIGVGAVAGGLLAAAVSRGNPAAIASGVLLGAGTGYVAGDVLDRQAQVVARQAAREALRTGQQTTHALEHGTVTAVAGDWGVMADGTPCKHTEIVVVMRGRTYTSTVCATPGARPGTWNLGPEMAMQERSHP